jgi:hypothetical protein
MVKVKSSAIQSSDRRQKMNKAVTAKLAIGSTRPMNITSLIGRPASATAARIVACASNAG